MIQTVPAAAVFVLIGAEPRTQWLPDDIRRDRWGFVVTGPDLMAGGYPAEGWPLQRAPMLLESSLPGVFAVGDVRCGSVKRVASAVSARARSRSAWSTTTYVATATNPRWSLPLTLIALSKVDDKDVGLASSLVNTGRMAGGSIGLAILGTVAWSSSPTPRGAGERKEDLLVSTYRPDGADAPGASAMRPL